MTSMNDGLDDAREALLTDEEPTQEPTDPVFELMDNDPDVRAAIAAEMKRRLFEQPQEAPPIPQHDPAASKLEQVRKDLADTEAWIDNFFQTKDTERDYAEYERRKEKARRLDREERLLMEERTQVQKNLQSADSVVDGWIQERIRQEKTTKGSSSLESYADRVRQMARTLSPAIRADAGRLREALQHFVLPNAFMQYSEQLRTQPRKRNVREDYADQGAYMDDGGEAPKKKGPYEDASDAERAFLRGIGLLKENRRQSDDGMIPTDTGYVIPVTRGKRNDWPHPTKRGEE